MKPTKTKKTFDCLEFKRKAQVRIYEETRGMTAREQIDYFTQHAENGPLGAWWKKLSSA